MTDRKLTEAEMISYLELSVAIGGTASLAPEEARRLLDLINRQKAEIEKWKTEGENQSVLWRNHFESIFESAKEVVRAEAVKEFAERLKERFETYTDAEEANAVYVKNLIDALVKEMTRGQEQP